MRKFIIKEDYLLTPTKCRQCGNELSDKAIELRVDLCPDCGGDTRENEE